ncbi:uncharacterized protein VICG_01015 [Vittaforma corneae ATCC 50505]|uniref:Guanylate cyclase domain-containing protein n=1 Tax=Vittaforma corneae (strain ATCC 50505) TaxID=993615 RepID=L2GM76_VITCO|nr:uncharacterized protein VICG_01015 [Vittaforma corneae ATCC 50505]ELA41998.1 hypothetical protein VICG_01015 [Vittaforma corneae ATCC 50505]
MPCHAVKFARQKIFVVVEEKACDIFHIFCTLPLFFSSSNHYTLKYLKIFHQKNKFKRGYFYALSNVMLKKTRFRTTSFMHLIIRVVYRQFYYIVSSIIFVLRINNANEQKIRTQPQSDLKLMSAKVDLNEEKECLKNTDESVPFSLKSPVIVLTDIIDNTRLFNEQPLKMRQCIVAHYKMIFSLLKRYGGHMVANEGDSFHLAFQHFENAIKFCKDLFAGITAK